MVAEINHLSEAYSWNISRIADAFRLDRGTVRRRLREAGVLPAGTRNGVSTYALKDVGPALFGSVVTASDDVIDPDKLPPLDRKHWYQSENERIKSEKEARQLVPEEEVRREMSALAKAVVNSLDSLPDMLERDAGLPPEMIEVVERVIDNVREQMYRVVLDNEGESDE